jgi:hypothetical protein
MKPALHRLKEILFHAVGVLVFCLSAGCVSAQAWQVPLERRVTENIEFSLSSKDTIVQTAMKPFHANQFNRTTVPSLQVDDRRYFSDTEARLFRNHMLALTEDDFELYIDVILDLDLGFDLGDTSNWQTDREVQIYNNTRGAAVYGRLGKHVSFHATVFENQAQFPLWLYNYTDSLGVVPGQGRFKELESNARDFNSSTGIISVEATPWLQIHFGHGKHFIGHGYRSMILSDVAFNYPFIRLQAETKNKKLRYVNTHAELHALDRLPVGEVPEALFQRKGFKFSYLSYMPHPRIEVGLYEGVIFQRWDSTGTQSYPATFYQPLPFVAAAVHGLNSTQNAVVGANAKIKASNDLFFYGQIVADQWEQRFTGFQAGFVWNNLLLPNLGLRIEYNEGGQGVYSHATGLQNYTHMNQGLAHPLGTNFKEYIVILQHRYKRFWSEWRGLHQVHDGGTRGNVAATPDAILAAVHQPGLTLISDLRLGYTLNPTSNMQAMLGWTFRDRESDNEHLVSSMVYVAFRIALFNRYYDI